MVATQKLLEQMTKHNVKRLIHLSSSVINSVAEDLYSESKRKQEELVLGFDGSKVILRPTLMFGWFDRKHLGWLARLMDKSPVFPVPGRGDFIRQPLFARDFCQVILRCVERADIEGVFNITGTEKISYLELIKSIKKITKSRAIIIRIPVWLFGTLLSLWGMWDKNPPFTRQQLEALVADDIFEIEPWPDYFSVTPTDLQAALTTTFNDPTFSKVVLEF